MYYKIHCFKISKHDEVNNFAAELELKNFYLPTLCKPKKKDWDEKTGNRCLFLSGT